MDGFQRARHESAFAQRPSNLTTGSLGNLAWFQQGNRIRLHVEVTHHGLPYGRDHLLGISAQSFALDLLSYHQPLLSIIFYREYGAGTGLKSRMAGLGRNFQVMRIKISTIDNNNVLEPTGDK